MADISGYDYGESLLGSMLEQVLMGADIVPGSNPGYETCKQIYSFHPLGRKMAFSPVRMAQSMPRQFAIDGSPEDELIDAFQKCWKALGNTGGDTLIARVMTLARVYGTSTLVVGTRGTPTDTPLELSGLSSEELYFNVLDPLNTAGSLVLEQDPNSPEFQKPHALRAGPFNWHATRCMVVMNEEPVYIQWSNSAFGFVGRSVYQRALFPLKSYVQSMQTDDLVTKKVALLVAKLKSPSSIIDNITKTFGRMKRAAINMAATGNVLQLGVDEDLRSVDLTGLEPPARYARENILKNIATAADMPASMINQETLAEGFGEGVEDAKQIARYVDGVRAEMRAVYDFLDRIVMRLAWNQEFYRSIVRKYPTLAGASYADSFVRWRDAFKWEWPNLLVEPDSEAVKRDAQIMESAIGLGEIVMPVLDPENRARVVVWLAETMNARKMLVSSDLDIDADALRAYVPPKPEKIEEPKTRAAYDI